MSPVQRSKDPKLNCGYSTRDKDGYLWVCERIKDHRGRHLLINWGKALTEPIVDFGKGIFVPVEKGDRE